MLGALAQIRVARELLFDPPKRWYEARRWAGRGWGGGGTMLAEPPSRSRRGVVERSVVIELCHGPVDIGGSDWLL
eukprot:COSAG02_NODE_2836_length_7923_cov_152.700153_8_plen_75_part_00